MEAATTTGIDPASSPGSSGDTEAAAPARNGAGSEGGEGGPAGDGAACEEQATAARAAGGESADQPSNVDTPGENLGPSGDVGMPAKEELMLPPRSHRARRPPGPRMSMDVATGVGAPPDAKRRPPNRSASEQTFASSNALSMADHHNTPEWKALIESAKRGSTSSGKLSLTQRKMEAEMTWRTDGEAGVGRGDSFNRPHPSRTPSWQTSGSASAHVSPKLSRTFTPTNPQLASLMSRESQSLRGAPGGAPVPPHLSPEMGRILSKMSPTRGAHRTLSEQFHRPPSRAVPLRAEVGGSDHGVRGPLSHSTPNFAKDALALAPTSESPSKSGSPPKDGKDASQEPEASTSSGEPPALVTYSQFRKPNHRNSWETGADGTPKTPQLGTMMSRQVRMAQVVQRRANLESLSSKTDRMAASGKSYVESAKSGDGALDEHEQIWGMFGQDHVRLLYLIYCYTMIQTDNVVEANGEPRLAAVPPMEPPQLGDDFLSEGDASADMWIRKMPLMVFMYEGIVQGVFDYDYAPAAEMVDGRRVYLNLTQEGRDDLDDLRQSGLLFGLKMSSVTYISTVSFRPTPDGLRLLATRLRPEDREAVHSLIYAPGEPLLQSSLLRVAWDKKQRTFVIYSTQGYRQPSSITDVESVSYVSSPYIPQVARMWGRDMSSNREQVPLLELAKTNIKDELDEVLLLDSPRILFGEWIPMGANQIFALNDRLGSSERVQGGLFTAQVDLNPLNSNFTSPSDGLTEVLVLDYDDSKYVNFEAEVHFPEEDGIVQIENFGIHVNEEGFLGYGLVVEGIMDRVEKRMSLDHLARLLVDIYVDSSKVLDNLLSPHQRLMLNTTYANNAEMRIKYSCIVATQIHPLLSAEEYLDKEAKENELKQVIGDTYAAHDLSATERLIIGRSGLLLVTDDLPKFEPILMCHLSLMARNVFMTSLFQRSYILMDQLKHIRNMIYNHESNPNSVTVIRNMLSQSSADITLLNEIQLYLSESLLDFKLPETTDNPAVEKLRELLHPSATLIRLDRRIRDMLKTIRGADGEADGLRNMVDAVSDSQNQRVQEAVQDNTKNLEDVYRANARASTSLEIMQVVLAGSLAFDLVDRVHGLYLGDAAELDWSVRMFAPIYDTPGVLLGINLACWLCLGLLIKFLLNHFAAQAAGWMAIRYTINLKYDARAMRSYLQRKNPDVEGGDSDKATVYHKYSWTERNTPENRKRWLGEPPRIEIMLDTKHLFLLKSFIQVATRRSRIAQKDVREIFFGELREAGVVNGYVAGIEEEQEEEFDPTKEAQERAETSSYASGVHSNMGSVAGSRHGPMAKSNTLLQSIGKSGALVRSLSAMIAGGKAPAEEPREIDGASGSGSEEERGGMKGLISGISRRVLRGPRKKAPESAMPLMPRPPEVDAGAGNGNPGEEAPILGVLKGGKSFKGKVVEVAPSPDSGSGRPNPGLKRGVTFNEKTANQPERLGQQLLARAQAGHRSFSSSFGDR